MRDLESAISLLELALIKDDHFALGFAWLAGLKALKELDRITDQNVKDSILLLADRAVELDSTIVESYLVLSQVYNYVLDDINALRFTYKALVAESGDSITSKVELIRRLGSIYARLGDLDRASWLYDEIIAITPGDLDVLHDKFYALAASKSVDKLVRLSEQIKAVDPNDVFIDIIMTHVLTEQKDFKSLENIYRKKNRTSNELIELDQYIFIYAYALRKNGNEAEAVKLITKFEKLISKNNSWLRAQILLFNGRQDQALGLLAKADIGWYNLTMCLINPVFESVMTDARFKSFLQRNTDRTRDLRERIYLLENKGYLPKPEVFFQKGG